jgi:F-type H+-transporting ATPase subunit b
VPPEPHFKEGRKAMRLFNSVSVAAVSSFLFAFSAAAAEEAAHGEGNSKVFPPFDTTHLGSTLFWLAVLFGLLYWLMSKKALPRIAETKQARREQIERDLAAAASMQKKAEEAEAAYTAALAKSRADAQSSASAAREAANAEAEKRRLAVETELTAKMVAAEAQISAAKASAMGNVASIATDAASEIVKQITGKVPVASDLKSAIAAVAKG